METLNELFEDMLKDVYFAENAVLKALPKMAKAAQSPELRAGFEDHLEETKGQVARLEQVFQILGKKPAAKECPAMKGLIEEATELMDEVQPSPLLDAGLAAHARAVEHYEIARYCAMHEWADTLGMDDVCALLAATLDEEEACQDALTQLATGSLNSAAAGDDPTDSDVKSSKSAASTKQAGSAKQSPKPSSGRDPTQKNA
jgi:ferritin-like metal-binding protein YciE